MANVIVKKNHLGKCTRVVSWTTKSPEAGHLPIPMVMFMMGSSMTIFLMDLVYLQRAMEDLLIKNTSKETE